MHVCKGSWAEKAFALATNNDSGGRKSRIRRSKEERKSMVESFIKKYQKSNNGSFPSLNLTHKEVGGSFYTVREIVREIIQENRVLAPPKVSLEEHSHSEFLEEHPLGSISMEPEIDLSESERVHMVTHIVPDKYHISSEEKISSSNGPYPFETDNEQTTNAVSEVIDKDEGSERTNNSLHAPNKEASIQEVSYSCEESPLLSVNKLEDKKIVNGSEVLDESPQSDKPLVTHLHYQDNIDGMLLSSGKFDGSESGRLSHEQYHNKNDQTVDKTEEFGQRIHMDTEKFVETSHAVKSPMSSDVVVETFPLRPVPRAILDVDEESSKLQETTGTLQDEAIQFDKKAFIESHSGFASEKAEEKHIDSTLGFNGEKRDEKMVVNLQCPSPENIKYPSTSRPGALDQGGITNLESKHSLPDATKASSYTKTLISKDSNAVGEESINQNNDSSSKGINPTLDRINLETWEGASKNSSRPESNPILAIVKAVISSFLKFWTE